MKIHKFIVLALLCLFLSTQSFAQLGRQIGFGVAISQISASDYEFKGSTGYEFNYGLFAKYSDKVEWTSNIIFGNVGFTFNELQLVSQNFSNYTVTQAEKKLSMILFGAAYQITYYVIPDQLGLIGGFYFGANFGDVANELSSTGGFYSTFLSKEPEKYIGKTFSSPSDIRTGPTSDKVLIDSDQTIGFINYGPRVGLSYTLAERFVFSGTYTMHLNKLFDSDEASNFNEFTGNPTARIINFSFAYKFLPSLAAKRF